MDWLTCEMVLAGVRRQASAIVNRGDASSSVVLPGMYPAALWRPV